MNYARHNGCNETQLSLQVLNRNANLYYPKFWQILKQSLQKSVLNGVNKTRVNCNWAGNKLKLHEFCVKNT